VFTTHSTRKCSTSNVDKIETEDDVGKSEKRKGQAKRKTYTTELKYKVLCEAKMNTFSDIDVAEKYGINKSLVSKWKKEANKMEDSVTQSHKKHLKKSDRQQSTKTYS